MEDATDIVRLQAQDALQRLDAQGIVAAERVAESALTQAVYWEEAVPNGEKLLFVRLFSPVVQREEVFLGNVLFNAFLSKAFARAVAGGRLGRAELVANDLGSYYFLVRTTSGLSELVDAFRGEVEHGLPDLFFGDQDESKGVYGTLSRMFTFRKSDFEPFPVYAVPQFLAPQLERAVRRELDRLLSPIEFPTRVRTALATIAFFYGRTSGGDGDAQSPPNFIDHLVNDKCYEGLLNAEDAKKALNIADVRKPAIKQSIDDETYATEGLRKLLSSLAQAFQSSIDGGSSKWLMGFLREKGKFLDLSAEGYLNALLADLQIGYVLLTKPPVGMAVPCRVCSMTKAAVADSYVTIGLNSFKFDNQSVRRQGEKVCIRCALHSYLAQKLLGTEMVSAGGKLPQVPKSYNLVFHYGKHTDAEVVQLVQRIDLIWNLVQQHHKAEATRHDIYQQHRLLSQKAERERDAQKTQTLTTEIAQKEVELRQAQDALAQAQDGILSACPWLRKTGASPVPAENPSLDIWSNTQRPDTKAERHVLGLGMGGYRMILVVLPQIRPPRDAKEHDFAQRRFSNSRVTVLALLSFLRETCGCDGPFYYQSLPTLAPGTFQRDTFYVRNEPVQAEEAQKRYEVITQLAWRLVWQRGAEGFVKKVVLAEKLLKDPLATFATVMRDSPILGQTKGNYKRLPGKYRQDWKAQDLTEYAKFIQQLAKL